MLKAPRTEIEFKHQFGVLLGKARTEAGLTPAELAGRIQGISLDGIGKIERGDRVPSWRVIERLVHGLPGSELAKLFDVFETARKDKAVVEQSEFNRVFPDLLRKAREHEGLSVRELSRRTAIHASYLSRLERGVVPPPMLQKVAVMVRELPDTELAHLFSRREDEKLKKALLKSTAEILELLGDALPRTFDAAWLSEIKHRLQKCVMMVEVSERTLKPGK